ncbi:hypothetical protein ACVCIC_00545 [Burkholderia glumae]|nr:hypothetical protein [Burkholderia glumae]QTP37315.1 hypothetical protein B7759_05957 [Burkholderia glumae]
MMTLIRIGDYTDHCGKVEAGSSSIGQRDLVDEIQASNDAQ